MNVLNFQKDVALMGFKVSSYPDLVEMKLVTLEPAVEKKIAQKQNKVSAMEHGLD